MYYFGRNPALNALANRITRDPNIVKTNTFGGAIGHPIIKNKLFNFFVYEKWKVTQPASKEQTLPTDAEKGGDFSHQLTPQGSLQTIYDPFTTKFDPSTSTVTRQPFPGNIVPPSRIDPAAAKLMGYLWAPNNPGDDLSGLNNFKKAYPWWENYYNFSDRVDYNLSDHWRIFARFSKFETRLDNPNWGGTIAVPSDNGGIMDALNATTLPSGPRYRKACGPASGLMVGTRACCNPPRASTSRTSISAGTAVPTQALATGGWCTAAPIIRPSTSHMTGAFIT